MKEKLGYLPQNQRKKILLICDDIRVHSGVATVAREMVINTAHHFNWVQIAGAINHPDKGKRLDLSQDTNANVQINDSSVTIYPADGYGDPNFLRQLIQIENPDAIFLITDPRYFIWLFQIENEIRRKIPIVYLNCTSKLSPSPATGSAECRSACCAVRLPSRNNAGGFTTAFDRISAKTYIWFPQACVG